MLKYQTVLFLAFSRQWRKVGVRDTLPAEMAVAVTLPSSPTEPRTRPLQAPPPQLELLPPEMLLQAPPPRLELLPPGMLPTPRASEPLQTASPRSERLTGRGSDRPNTSMTQRLANEQLTIVQSRLFHLPLVHSICASETDSRGHEKYFHSSFY